MATGPRSIPWRLVLEVAGVISTRFRDDVPPKDRKRLSELVRRSKGDPRALTSAERHEVLEILRTVDVQRLGRDVTALVGARQLRKRLRR